MFDSLADQIKNDERATTSNTQRAMIGAAIVVVALVVFVGLYFAVRALG